MFRKLRMTALTSSPFTTSFSFRSKVLDASGKASRTLAFLRFTNRLSREIVNIRNKIFQEPQIPPRIVTSRQ